MGYDTIIHTAALKYVPEGEFNVSECISVNVEGTQNVINSARWADVGKVVVVSTDKAVQPTNVYGMTKALCERLVGETADYGDMKVTAVRYGNVVGSTGSVVPEFIRQAEETGEVTVTDEYMTRFWLGVDDAIFLIITALHDECKPGSIVIPTPKSMMLGGLVRAIVPEAEIICKGLRPGEKMHEVLLTNDESYWVETVKPDTGLYELPSIKNRHAPESPRYSFEINSSEAEPMEPEEFVELVRDAELV